MIPTLLKLLVGPCLAAAPIAEAGLPLLAYPEDKVYLNGSGSADPDGEALFFSWYQVGGPAVVLEGAETASPSFFVPSGGTYRFELVVEDGTAESAPDAVEVVVPEAGRDYYREGGCAVRSGEPLLSALFLLILGLRRRP